MPTFYPTLSQDLADWALSQPLFFTASAPAHGSHINVSPKGLPSSTLRVLSPNKAAYLDATGSGCETISHVYENGRLTLMWCSFGKSPRILRWFCRGEVVEVGSERWAEARGWFRREGEGEGMGDGEDYGARAVIVLHIWKVQTSCGFGVPICEGLVGGKEEEEEGEEEEDSDVEKAAEKKGEAFVNRPTLVNWAQKTMRKDNGRGIQNYRVKNNCRSLDGLPGLRAARRDHGEVLLLGDTAARARRIRMQWGTLLLGIVLAVMVIWFGMLLGVVDFRFKAERIGMWDLNEMWRR